MANTERVTITIPKSNLALLKKTFRKQRDSEAIQAFLDVAGLANIQDWQEYKPQRNAAQIIPKELHPEIIERHAALKAEGVKNPTGEVLTWLRDELKQQGKKLRPNQPSEAIVYRIIRNHKRESA